MQKWVYNYLALYVQLTTVIVNNARVPSSDGVIIKKHRALLVEGDVEESLICL